MNEDEHESWYDEDAGPVVRLYAITHGRSASARPELDMLTLVVNVSAGVRPRRSEPEYAEILRLSRTALSVAEIAAHLRLPLTATKILVGDLIDDGHLEYRSPDPAPTTGRRNQELLRAVFNAIQAI
ncbi:MULTISPECIES: DUF742 domain-containing protein [Nocardia]|uniref:DUF742 domain-containing protein n=1 Tax=Nocardia TaxID=1817 RepID=UPI000D69CC9C|nr:MULTISPECIES: DUF742 domain-containing protein [Nocardia]